ncbi:MAG: periplasmic heavy metal sensor [Thermoanaerobaculales bacterium]
MKRLLVGLIVLAVAIPAVAQESHLGDAAKNGIVNFLQLTPDQVATWDQLLEDRQIAAEPLREAIAQVQAEIEALFASGDPDPAELGSLVIDRHDLGEDLAQVRRDYVDGFEAMLDEQQAGKLGFIRRADRVQPLIPAFRLFGLLPRR